MKLKNRHPATLPASLAGLFACVGLLFWCALPWAKEASFAFGVWLAAVLFAVAIRQLLPLRRTDQTSTSRCMSAAWQVFPWVLLFTPSIQYDSFMSLPLPAGFLVVHWLSHGAYGDSDHNGPIACFILAAVWLVATIFVTLRNRKMPSQSLESTASGRGSSITFGKER